MNTDIKSINSLTIEELAGALYEEYCRQVGGVAFNGDHLPDWNTFRADPEKQIQANAWLAVAQASIALQSEEAPSNPVPTVGRIVHYVLGVAHKRKGEVVPGLIVRVWNDDCVQLKIFLDQVNDDEDTDFISSAVRSDTPEPGYWHWPQH